MARIARSAALITHLPMPLSSSHDAIVTPASSAPDVARQRALGKSDAIFSEHTHRAEPDFAPIAAHGAPLPRSAARASDCARERGLCAMDHPAWRRRVSGAGLDGLTYQPPPLSSASVTALNETPF